VITGRPDYLAFGRLELASSGWIQPTLGDAFTGIVAALLNILIAVLVVHYKARCYRCCCIKNFKDESYQMGNYPPEVDDEYMDIVPLSDAQALDTLVSRTMSRQVSIEDSVKLGKFDSSDSGSSQAEVSTGKKPPTVVIVNQQGED